MYVFQCYNGSGPAYLSELLHVYTQSRTLRSSSDTRMLKIQQYKHKTVAFAPYLALDPTFGIHSHKTTFIFQSQTENLPLLTVFSPQLILVPSFCYS